LKTTDVRTRVVEWRGPTAPPQPHFCANPTDLLALPAKDSMASFRFHGWLIVEVFTDAGHVGIGLTIKENEPPRDSWRLQFLRGWSHENSTEIFTGVSRTGRPDGL
jgi:hypothetical protein